MVDGKKLIGEIRVKATCLHKMPSTKLRQLCRVAPVLVAVFILCQSAHAQLVSSGEVSSGEFFIAFACVVMVGIAAKIALHRVKPQTDTLSKITLAKSASPQ